MTCDLKISLMKDSCNGYLFSNEPLFIKNTSARFSFCIVQNNLERNELELISNNPYLIKFEYKINSKYFTVYDQDNEISYFCAFNSFISHFICYISKNGKTKIYPKNKKRFNWLKIDISDPDSIENIFNFAFLPHTFNNFYQISQNPNNFTEEFQNMIFRFRPNGHFLNPNDYFDYAIDFLLFFNENEKQLVDSPLFNEFIKRVVGELSDMKQYFEFAVVSFCDKNKKIVPPLEVSHNQKFDQEKAKKLCDTVIIYYSNLFLLWAFNANFSFDLFDSLYKKWKPLNETKFDVEKIFEIVIKKLESNDFSNYSLKKYLEFVKLYIQEDQIKDVQNFISDNQSKFSKSVLKHINAIILHSDEQIQVDKLTIARIDQKDYEYQNSNNDANNNSNDAPINDDQSYVNHINELRGIWFNSIPNSFQFQRKEKDKAVYIPPFTFRLFDPPKSIGGPQRKRTFSNRPAQNVMNSFPVKTPYNSSRPSHGVRNPT